MAFLDQDNSPDRQWARRTAYWGAVRISNHPRCLPNICRGPGRPAQSPRSGLVGSLSGMASGGWWGRAVIEAVELAAETCRRNSKGTGVTLLDRCYGLPSSHASCSDYYIKSSKLWPTPSHCPPPCTISLSLMAHAISFVGVCLSGAALYLATRFFVPGAPAHFQLVLLGGW